MNPVGGWAERVIYFTIVRLALSVWLLGAVIGGLFTIVAFVFEVSRGGSQASPRAVKRLLLLLAWPIVLMTRTGRSEFREAFRGEL